MSKAKKRFIDANALKKAIDHTGVDMLESADYFGFTYKKIMRVIDDAPTADVAPVVHAKWDVNGRCTNCGSFAPFYCMTSTYHKSPYCFECGAKMRCDNEQE